MTAASASARRAAPRRVKPKISVLCPTRGRRDSVFRLHDSLEQTVTGPGLVELWLYIDSDDLSYGAAAGGLPRGDKVACHALIGERIVLSAMWNELADRCAGEILMQCGDDIVFRSYGWDQRVIDEFAAWPDHVVFVHGDAKDYGPGFGTHGFVHRRWVETLGWFTAPHYSCDYGDTTLNEIANMLGRRVYLPDVVTEHMHPIWGKGAWDQTHADRLARGQADQVAVLFEQKRPERVAAAEKLRAIMTV